MSQELPSSPTQDTLEPLPASTNPRNTQTKDNKIKNKKNHSIKKKTPQTTRGGNSAQNHRKGDTGKFYNVTEWINFLFTASASFQKKAKHWNFTISNHNQNYQHYLDPAAHKAKRILTYDLDE
ncbi:hypothetical protein VP01_4543g3 [Puccinia sorghi]|uniref:Uncharacterized protein n=1 Tax=Puccinia sorghi TaxID=27349 RepID=A0A0L6UNU4_9BASI|nr:hypothetical protein VP01_4543g3 [Puccinia sorghi]